MKILVTYDNKQNPYCQEIYSIFEKPDFEITYYKGLPNTDLSQFDIVHIHWPETLTDWKDPDSKQLDVIEKKLQNAGLVIATLHNYRPHFFSSPNSLKLYQIVYKHADGIIHLGQFGLNEYQKKYNEFANNQLHCVIPHPLYSPYPNTIDRVHARSKLGIARHAKVVLIFGKIRHQVERTFIIRVFRKLNLADKLLLVSRQLPSWFYSEVLKRINVLRKLSACLNKRVLNEYFFYNRVPDADVQLFLKAADVLFVPRANTLNSGLPFLTWSFDRVVVAPDCGNISECMKAMDNPLYDPGNIDSAVLAIKKGMELSQGLEAGELFNRASERYRPEIISNKTKEFINQVLAHGKSI